MAVFFFIRPILVDYFIAGIDAIDRGEVCDSFRRWRRIKGNYGYTNVGPDDLKSFPTFSDGSGWKMR